jgi:hypothetical protein
MKKFYYNSIFILFNILLINNKKMNLLINNKKMNLLINNKKNELLFIIYYLIINI